MLLYSELHYIKVMKTGICCLSLHLALLLCPPHGYGRGLSSAKVSSFIMIIKLPVASSRVGKGPEHSEGPFFVLSKLSLTMNSKLRLTVNLRTHVLNSRLSLTIDSNLRLTINLRTHIKH